MTLKQIKRDVVYEGVVIDLVVDQVTYPSGRTGVREVVRHPGGAVALPVLADDSVLLVEQLRYPLGTRILELPAGKLSPGEDPLACARRELEEETGWCAQHWEKLASIYTSPGFCDEELHLYLATDLRRLPDGPDRSEGERDMALHTCTLSELVDRIERGEIRDAKTICAVMILRNRMKTAS